MLDKILTHRFWGLMIFAALITFVFYQTFSGTGKAASDGLARLIDSAVDFLDEWMALHDTSPLIQSLLIDGICAGIGSVLSFLPSIAVLFFFIALMEESGYLMRITVLLDSFLRPFGLSGQAVIPFIMGFGCSVPAVIAAGSLLKDRQKFLVIFLIPFMSCSAKIPIYTVFTAAFFSSRQPLIMGLVYLTGIMMALGCCLIIKQLGVCWIEKQVALPAGNSFSFRKILTTVLQNCRGFIKKTFTVIFAASVIIWFLQSFSPQFEMTSDSSRSLLAHLGMLASPLFAPLGFGNWQAASAIIAGLTAKESVISTLAVLAGSGGIAPVLHGVFDPLTAYCFMVFCLLYVPCAATISAVRKETGSWRFPALMVISQLLAAWFVSFLIFHIGRLII